MSNASAKAAQRDYPWKRRQRRIFYTCCIAAVLIGLPFLNGVRVRANVHREIEKIRAKGEPVSYADLPLFAGISPKAFQNAAAYQKAFNAKTTGFTPKQGLDFDDALKAAPAHGRYPDTLIALLHNRLGADSQKLQLLHEAIQGPPARFPLDWKQGAGMPLPQLAQLRQAVQLLQWDAILAAHEGRAQDATQDMTEILTAAATLNEDPVMICQLVRISCQSYARAALSRVLEITPLTDEQLMTLGDRFKAGDPPDALTRTLIAERVFGISVFDSGDLSAIFNMGRSGKQKVAKLLQLIGWFGAEEFRYLDLTARLIEASRNPHHVAIPAMKELEDKVLNVDGGPGLLTAAILPAISNSARSFARGAAALRTAYAATAVERYRLKNGAPPAKLSDLAPAFLEAVPEDPFDGQPLRYKPLENGYIIYSIGENGKDDGGEESSSPRKAPPDVCFHVER